MMQKVPSLILCLLLGTLPSTLLAHAVGLEPRLRCTALKPAAK